MHFFIVDNPFDLGTFKIKSSLFEPFYYGDNNLFCIDNICTGLKKYIFYIL